MIVVVLVATIGGFTLIASERPPAVRDEPLQGTVVDKYSAMTRTYGTCGFAFVEFECNAESSSHELDVQQDGGAAVNVVVDWTPLTFIPTAWRACDVGDDLRRDDAGNITCENGVD